VGLLFVGLLLYFLIDYLFVGMLCHTAALGWTNHGRYSSKQTSNSSRATARAAEGIAVVVLMSNDDDKCIQAFISGNFPWPLLALAMKVFIKLCIYANNCDSFWWIFNIGMLGSGSIKQMEQTACIKVWCEDPDGMMWWLKLLSQIIFTVRVYGKRYSKLLDPFYCCFYDGVW